MPARTLPNLGLKAGYNLGENGWGDDMTVNLVALSVLSQATALDKVAAVPGSPTNGDIYIIDETNGTQPNRIAARDNGAWVYLTPVEGWLIYNRAANYYERFDGTVWAEFTSGSSSIPYSIPFGFTTAPSASEVLLLHVFAEAVTLADDFGGAQARIGTNPTASFVLDVQKNGSSVGSITVATDGSVTFATTGGAVSFAIDDLISVVGPGTIDATIANCAFTFLGTRG